MSTKSFFNNDSAGISGDTTLPMAPMIDIVFQLIAFFILALSTDDNKVNPSLIPPDWKNAVKNQPSVKEVIIEVDSNGDLVTNDGVFGPKSKEFEVNLSKLITKSPGNSNVVIRADRNSRYETTAKILEFCRESKNIQVGLRLRIVE